MARYSRRCDNLRKRIAKTEANSLLVTNSVNVTYLTGFTGDDSYLLLMEDSAVLISDRRYTIQLREECPELDLYIRAPGTTMHEETAKVLRKCQIRQLGVEANSMSLGLRSKLSLAAPKVDFIETYGLVEELRILKDQGEIARIRSACRQASRAFDVVRSLLTPAMTEKQIAAELEYRARLFGASGLSFPPIVAVGPRAALPHATPTNIRISSSPFVLIDWGACDGLYRSDLTRVLVTGKLPPKLRRIHRIVLEAQREAIRAIRPGVTCQAVDQVARDIISKAGYGKQFGHGLGHGIGLEIHEAPWLANNQQVELRPGMVVTVEPGIYFPGWGGVRIEDDILVTRSGYEVLTDVPVELEECVVA
ncbi:MAG: aminopeptidase P family protein [Pirellulales bacterium]|nr:aminopeptidase P family protein [Pirellulales bacterium]